MPSIGNKNSNTNSLKKDAQAGNVLKTAKAPINITDYLLKLGYKKQKTLGQGGFARVYKCAVIDKNTGQETDEIKAIKFNGVITKKNAKNKKSTVPKREVQNINFLQESGKLKIINSDGESDADYLMVPEVNKTDERILVCDFANIGDLKNIIKISQKEKMKVNFYTGVVEIARQIAKGLYILHHKYGMSHNDIKPANILVVSSNGNRKFRFKLSDFGLAGKINEVVKGGTKGYRPIKYGKYVTDKQAYVIKNDTYALGTTYLDLICSSKQARKDAQEYLSHQIWRRCVSGRGYTSIYKICNDKKWLCNIGNANPVIINDFLVLIAKMLRKDYAKRLTIDEVLLEIERIAHLIEAISPLV